MADCRSIKPGDIKDLEQENQRLRKVIADQTNESFNGKFRDELLNGEIFDTVIEARVITEQWRNHYNKIRPHSTLGYRPPAPESFIPYQVASA